MSRFSFIYIFSADVDLFEFCAMNFHNFEYVLHVCFFILIHKHRTTTINGLCFLWISFYFQIFLLCCFYSISSHTKNTAYQLCLSRAFINRKIIITFFVCIWCCLFEAHKQWHFGWSRLKKEMKYFFFFKKFNKFLSQHTFGKQKVIYNNENIAEIRNVHLKKEEFTFIYYYGSSSKHPWIHKFQYNVYVLYL
jgi:hypothetical protein